MTYSVRWRTEASDELAEIWLNSDPAGRHDVTAAADSIDKALATRPNDCGESRDEQRRIFYSQPLAVIFQVFEPDWTVYVIQVWHVA